MTSKPRKYLIGVALATFKATDHFPTKPTEEKVKELLFDSDTPFGKKFDRNLVISIKET